ncbi:MAG: hypothetical protein H8E98_07700 [Bacteroidetes bacterium]|nr:hypothetical protein [Bacteroidota bacterium]
MNSIIKKWKKTIYFAIFIAIVFLSVTSFSFFANCTIFDCLKIYEPAVELAIIQQTGACVYIDPILEDQIVGAIQDCQNPGFGFVSCNKQRCRWWKSCCKNGDIPPL